LILIGIDPGVSGALSVYEHKKLIEVLDMPTMSEGKKNKKQINSAQLSLEIKKRVNGSDENAVVIEHVTAMPGQGVTSMFNFGQSFGVVKGKKDANKADAILIGRYFLDHFNNNGFHG
jgi:crossover junction endodeoxyribonuclease RuvC